MSQASQAELLMLELINEERTSRGLDPLAINDRLNEASEDHSAWMLDSDTFSHHGENGSSHGDRIEDADYALEGSWRTAENIGWQSERGAPGIEDDVRDIHASLMASPGHRANILNPELEDIGIGVELGDFQGFEAVMITQNFGTSAAENGPTGPDTPPEEADVPMAEVDPPVDSTPPVTPPETTPEPSDPSTFTPFDFGGFFDDFFDFRLPTAPGTPSPSEPSETPTGPSDLADLSDDFFRLPVPSGDGPVAHADAPNIETATDFQGTVTVNGETVTTNDRTEFDLLTSTLFEGFGDMSCGADLQFA